MKIPVYPESRTITMADKPLLDRVFSELRPKISELSFAGLYLFRHAHDYRLCLAGDAIVVLGNGYNGSPYFLPPLCGDVPQALNMLFADKRVLYGADETFAGTYLSSGRYDIEEERDSFDYLYLREDLAALPGSRYHKKKNRINYFTNRHRFQVQQYDDRFCQQCLDLLNTWYRSARYGSTPSLELEVSATSEALRNAAELGLQGIVILVADAVASFALGEKLNPDTAVCHFEKSDPFMEGLPQLVNREFAKQLFTECRYLNREQDLGESGLRNAKLSYHPLELIKKFRVIPILNQGATCVGSSSTP